MDPITKHLTNPFAGLNQLLERANLTGFDTTGIVEARRKDIDAILHANRIVYAGAQALAQKQFEILRTTMNAARSAVTDGTFSGSPMEIAHRQRDMMAKAFQVSLAHMRELAEIVRKAQADAFAVVKVQVEHDIHDLVGRAKGKGAAKAGAGSATGAARKPKAKAKGRARAVAKAPAAKPKAPAAPAATVTARAKPRAPAAPAPKAAPKAGRTAKTAAPAAQAKPRKPAKRAAGKAA